eukprot:TRINITY_DN19921_c0_g1_i1.p1 TRINITY_DN19921_c0_g1~~TRINITY_DN19921_c0_g1_i1.p1  ORF type:complete len:401 (+),score=66.97 TRINITY_DN19921_c0_g1_i1:69-1271(+)
MASFMTALLVACASWLAVSSKAKKFHGHKRSPNRQGHYEHVLTALPHTDPTVLASLPESLDWRDMHGVDYMASVKNQHQPGPTYCGACWAFATTGHINARFNIARGNRWPRAEVNVQTLISCGPGMPDGCGGSEPDVALKFMHEYGLPHDSCHTYQGKSLPCTAYTVCQDCMTEYKPVCWARPKFPLFKVKEYGNIRPDGNISTTDVTERKRIIDDMVVRMKAEIFSRGPIVCQLACPDPEDGATATVAYRTNHSKPVYGGIRGYVDDYTPFFNMAGENFEPFIFNDKNFKCSTGDWDTCVDHDIIVAGWGHEDGTPYWLIQNSWGEWWGEGGYFRIIMGENNLGIESGCNWGVPDLEGFDEGKHGLQQFPAATPDGFDQRFTDYKKMTSRDDTVTTIFS